MIVAKFGGTSIGNADRISNVANIIKSHINKKPVVVVSAVGGITNKLIELGNTAAEGKGNEVFENIKSIHYEILEILELDKSLVDNDIENLAVMIDEIKSSKNISKNSITFIYK